MGAVAYSDDFARITAQPLREVIRERGEALSRELSPMLLTAAGKREGWKLNWLQALAIDEAIQRNGAYLQLPVGEGKTLLTWLFGYIFDAHNPLLIVPEALIEKTHIEFNKYARYWVTPPRRPKVMGLKQLVPIESVDLLARIAPDLYLLDEVDLLKNQESSMSKRIARDIDARDVPCIAMTGTGGRFSILDISHMITWALKEHAPVPLDHDEVERWADAIDEKTKFEGFGKGRRRRTRPGVLSELAPLTTDDDPDLELLTELGYARSCFRKRLTGTVGCIISDTDSCDKQLTIKLVTAPRDRKIEAVFKDFRDHDLTPTGEDVIDSLTFWMLEDALGAGFCPRWINPPPDWWADARKNYAKVCAAVIKRTAWSDNPLDTARAVRKEFPGHPAVEQWLEVKDEWKGEREQVWHSSSVVDWASEWATKTHGIVWVKSLAVGEALSEATGLTFYAAQGRDVSGRSIERDSGRSSVILSVGANMRGRNLQDRWCHNLCVGVVQSARYHEQIYGRTHRRGQTDDVTFEWLLTSGGSLYSFERAGVEARFVHATQGQRQKILRARHIPCVLPGNEKRWTTKATQGVIADGNRKFPKKEARRSSTGKAGRFTLRSVPTGARA